MRYVFESIIIEWVLFPFFTFFIIGIFTAPFLWVIEDGMLFALLLVSLITGFYFGRLHARKSDLPSNFADRYWPLIAPMVLILAVGIFSNILGYYKLYYYVEIIMTLTLCFALFIVSFAAFVPPKKRLASTKRNWQAGTFVVTIFLLLVWQVHWQVKQNRENMIINLDYYEGSTVSDEAVISWYWPWSETDKLANLDTLASLLINERYPTIDGAESFVPIYSAVVNEVYQVDDKNELQNYMTCSKSAGAYNRLISGDVDVIFVLQPSDGHLEAAKNAGVELQLTPIAKEAFVFFVNNRNTVSDLSIEQIQDIYLRKITNWKQVGGDDKKILAFQSPLDSGSQTTMLKEVMKDKELPLPLESMRSTKMGGILRNVAVYRDQEESIGYSFRFFAQVMVVHADMFYRRGRQTGASIPAEHVYPGTKPVKLLSVNGIAPTPENIRNGSYPFTTDIFAVTAGTSNPHVRSLIDWLLSPQGQELIEKTGYVRIR